MAPHGIHLKSHRQTPNVGKIHSWDSCSCWNYLRYRSRWSSSSIFWRSWVTGTSLLSVTQLTSYFNPSPAAGPRTRGSVRRTSGFVQIALTLIAFKEPPCRSLALTAKYDRTASAICRGHKPHERKLQNSTISGFPDPAAHLVRKGPNFESFSCGLSPPVSEGGFAQKRLSFAS